jgi:glycosyltransferase involved in cell wall biosynthesis
MASTKETLILTDWYHPGYKAGGPITSLYNLMRLIGTDLRPKVFTRNTDWYDPVPYDLKSDEWIQREGLETYYSSGNHFRKVIHAIRSAGVVYINGFYSIQFNSGPLLHLLLFNRKPQVVLAPRGMLGAHALRLKPVRKQILIGLLRVLGIQKRVLFHAASISEKEGIMKIYPRAEVEVVSNVPIEPNNGDLRASRINSLLSVGRISKVKNSLGLINLMTSFKDLNLLHIGSADDNQYESLCKSEAGNNVNFVNGANRDDISKHLNESSFFISMTTGENFGHAIIEALAQGCPVIISDQTPWNDLESFGAGWVISLENPERWKEVLSGASKIEQEDYFKMSARAKEYVRQKFDFDDLRSRYLKLFQAEN